MWVRAFRRGLCLLALVAVLSGCSSAAKQHYLRHLEATVSPMQFDQEPVVVAVPKTPGG
jgi:PBP1b-binding outer membrane lipoprotein LpoB